MNWNTESCTARRKASIDALPNHPIGFNPEIESLAYQTEYLEYDYLDLMLWIDGCNVGNTRLKKNAAWNKSAVKNRIESLGDVQCQMMKIIKSINEELYRSGRK